MPFKFTEFAKKTKRATLDLGEGDTINFEFRMGLVTPRFLADVQSLNDANAVTPALILAVSQHTARLVTWWDLQGADGAMFPLDVERLAADIPMEAQIALLLRCINVVQPSASDSQAEGDGAGEAVAPVAPEAVAGQES